MAYELLIAIILTLLPITELRLGLPLALIYANNSGIPSFIIFILILTLNLLLIFFIFFFLDNLHKLFLKWNFYKKVFEKSIKKIQKKTTNFEKKYKRSGFIALVLLVAVPLPFTGAYSGCLISWLIGLDRKKSIYAIGLGVIIAGLIIYLLTMGILSI
jgi:uncharacterized membrane protein